MRADAIISAIQTVTKPWAKQRKAEERDSNARSKRQHYYTGRVNFSEVAECILPAAYQHASGNGKFTVSKRQLYYSSREEFKNSTGREIDAQYFSNTLLVQYLNRHPELDWKITADPRGTFTIPNAAHEIRIPCGTIAIDKYLMEIQAEDNAIGIGLSVPHQWPSSAPGQRYAAILYCEKEGFEPLLREAQIAERFNLAIVSCKGQSVVAARKLVDQICHVNGGLPLFIVHDFDKSGFEIAECLTTESDEAVLQDRVAYHFEHEINWIDFGLRLVDVEHYKLQSESVECKGLPPRLTDKEKEFFKAGRRVELNAFTAPQFVEWLENKLKEHLPERFVPTDAILEAAYRRALAVAEINRRLKPICDDALRDAQHAPYPISLKTILRSEIKATEEIWDKVVYRLACQQTRGAT